MNYNFIFVKVKGLKCSLFQRLISFWSQDKENNFISGERMVVHGLRRDDKVKVENLIIQIQAVRVLNIRHGKELART